MGYCPPTFDFTGQVVGHLTILSLDAGSGPKARWLCECVCGKRVTRSHAVLLRSRPGKNPAVITPNCGCIRATKVTTHGMTNHPLFVTWAGMIRRCHNPNDRSYPRYGGRSIEVCEAWRASFLDWYQYMGDKPGPEYSIDRIDNDGNYEPGNVRWATPVEQIHNRRPADQFQQRTLKQVEDLPTHCGNGHEWTEENTRWSPAGDTSRGVRRVCRQCNRDARARERARDKARKR